MRLYNVVIPISKNLGLNQAMQLFLESIHIDYDIDICSDIVLDKGVYCLELEHSHITIYQSKQSIACHFTIDELNIRQIFDFVVNKEVGFASIIIEKECIVGGTHISRYVRMPYLLKSLFWHDFVGIDNDLVLMNHAHLLQKNQIESICSLFCGNENPYRIPVIYVSITKNCSYLVDIDRLSGQLAGQAHVVVESNPYVHQSIIDVCSDCPSDGDIWIFLPNGKIVKVGHSYKNFYCNKGVHFSMQKLQYICDIVRRQSVHVMIPKELTKDFVRMNVILENHQDTELMSLYEDMLSEKDVEISELQKEEQELKERVHDLESEVLSLHSCLNTDGKHCDGDGVLIHTKGFELYDGEFQDIILKVLQKYYEAAPSDIQTRRTRKFEVLEMFLNENSLIGNGERIAKAAKALVKNSTLNTKGRREMERLGFHVCQNDSMHMKLTFGSDDNRMVSIPISPSDHSRGGKNLARMISSTWFE